MVSVIFYEKGLSDKNNTGLLPFRSEILNQFLQQMGADLYVILQTKIICFFIIEFHNIPRKMQAVQPDTCRRLFFWQGGGVSGFHRRFPYHF